MPHGAAVWSRNAGTNQTIDDNAYLQEGQSAPTLNNAVRGVMQSFAEYRDDNLGVLAATRGASEVYAFTPYQAIPDLTQAFTLSFIADAANQAPAKLAVGALASKPIRRKFGRELGPGDITPDVIYTVRWRPSLDYFLVLSPEIEAPGTIKHVAHAIVDPGWVKCNGQAVARTTYAALFAIIGTVWGAADGATAFLLPDFSGRTLFGADDMAGTLAGRIAAGTGGVAGTLGSVGGVETVTLTTAQLPAHSFTATMDAQGGHSHTFSGTTGTVSNDHTHTFSGTTSGHGADHTHAITATGTTDTVGAHSHAVGSQNNIIVLSNANSPSYTDAAGVTIGSTGPAGAHAHNVTVTGTSGPTSSNHTHTYSGSTGGISANHSHTYSGTTSTVAAHTHTITVSSIGSGAAHSNMPPAAVVNILIKT